MLELSPPLPVLPLLCVGGLSRLNTLALLLFPFVYTLEASFVWITCVPMEEPKNTVKNQFRELAVNIYDAGMQQLITQYHKCTNLHGDCVEKLFKVSLNYIK
jgi:hypothetical protein